MRVIKQVGYNLDEDSDPTAHRLHQDSNPNKSLIACIVRTNTKDTKIDQCQLYNFPPDP